MTRPALLAVALAAVTSGFVYGQARSAPDWTTTGFDAQRSSWVRADPYISIPNLTKFQFIWKVKVDNESRFGSSLTAPVALGNLMTFRGFKSLVFVGGSSNNVYAIDYDFGTIFWRTHHNYAAGAREFAGSPACPGGMTVPLTRATPLVPPAQLAFFGFARPPRPAKGEVGEPGKGAPQLAEIAARLAARGKSGGDTPAPAAPARGAAGASASAPVPPNATADKPRVVRPTNAVFSVAADGLLRGLIPDTGDLAFAPARFLPANATATGLIWTEGFVYAATTNACGGAPEAVWGLDFSSETRPVVSWETGGVPVAGIAVGADGTVYAATGSGASQYANSIVALDGATLKVRDRVTRESGFNSAPVVFTEGQKSYLAATSEGRLSIFDAASLGGADDRTALAVTADAGLRFAPDGLATWRDESGTRWILAAHGDAIGGFKFVDKGGVPSIERGWTSRTMVSPRAPIIVNGVVFALAGGNASTNATLYALDPTTGKDLWSSGRTMTGIASAGLSAGTGQVYVVTSDNTVWSFGIPLAIN